MADAFGGHLTFPTLRVGDLIEGFRLDIGTEFDMREDDFTHPSKERWVRLYCFLLAHMTDNDVDDVMTRLRSVGHEYLDYPELYAESQLMMNLAKFMAQMLIECKIVEFTVDDIVRPTKKRLTHVLSGIMNYNRFRANRKEEFGNIILKMASQVEQKESLRGENEELAKKIEEIRKRRAEESEAVAKVLGEVEISGSQLDQLRKNNAVLKKGIDDFKLQIGKKQLDMQKRQERATRVAAELQKIEEQIVTSPDRFEAEIRDFDSRVEQAEKLQQEKIDRLNKLRKLQNPQMKAESLEALKKLWAELKKEETREQLTVELASIRGHVHDLREAGTTLHKDIQKMKLISSSKQERLEKSEVIHRREEEEAELALQKMTLEGDKKMELGNEWEIIESARQLTRLETSKQMKEHEENVKLLREAYALLLTTFESYNQNVLAAMGNSIPDDLKIEMEKKRKC